MGSLTILSAVSLIIFICVNFQFTLPQPTPVCATPPGYDITNLTKASFWQFDKNMGCVNDTSIKDECTFFFSFCKPLAEAKKCQNSSVCQWSMNDPEDIVKLGEYVYDPFFEKDINGFYAFFGSGQQIFNRYTNQTCNVSVMIEFDCDSRVYWSVDEPNQQGVAPEPIEFSGIFENSCSYYIKFAYAGACYRIIPQPTTTAIDPPPSLECIPPKGYDIEVLKLPAYWVIDIISGCSMKPGSPDSCQLYLAVCKPFESVTDCNGASACIRYPNSGGKSSMIVGNYTNDPFTSHEVNGFDAEFPSGGLIMNQFSGQACNVSIVVEFDCDETAIWVDQDFDKPSRGPEPTLFRPISADSCQIYVKVPYSGACFKLNPSNPSKGLSTGSILLILISVAIFVYLSVGMTYNKCVEKQSGARVIPHYVFWTSIYTFIVDGIVYLWKLVTCQNTRKAVYDSI